MKYPVPALADQIVSEWADKLSERLGRSHEAIISEGLLASDFPIGTLKITLMDDSFVAFRYAFVIISEKQKTLAVFTEHCGYHLFPSHEATVEIVDG